MVGCCEYHSGRKGEGEAPRGAAYGWAALYIRANLCGVHCPSSPWGVNPLPTNIIISHRGGIGRPRTWVVPGFQRVGV